MKPTPRTGAAKQMVWRGACQDTFVGYRRHGWSSIEVHMNPTTMHQWPKEPPH